MVSSFYFVYKKDRRKPMNEYERYKEENCKDCTIQCDKGIVQRIDGTVHCVDKE